MAKPSLPSATEQVSLYPVNTLFITHWSVLWARFPSWSLGSLRGGIISFVSLYPTVCSQDSEEVVNE